MAKIITTEQLKTIRKELGLTQRELAALSKYSKTHVNAMENGIAPITEQLVKAIKKIILEKTKKLKIILDTMPH